MVYITVKSYDHINSSFSRWDTPTGRRIRNKDDYDRAMKEEGMITSEEAADRVRKRKDYKLSGEAEEIIREAKLKSKNGKLRLTMADGLTTRMIDKGIIKQKGYGLEHLPEHLKRGL